MPKLKNLTNFLFWAGLSTQKLISSQDFDEENDENDTQKIALQIEPIVDHSDNNYLTGIPSSYEGAIDLFQTESGLAFSCIKVEATRCAVAKEDVPEFGEFYGIFENEKFVVDFGFAARDDSELAHRCGQGIWKQYAKDHEQRDGR